MDEEPSYRPSSRGGCTLSPTTNDRHGRHLKSATGLTERPLISLARRLQAMDRVPYPTSAKNPPTSEDRKTILYLITNGPKMGPKLRETSVKYVNIRPEMIENARA